VTLHVIDARMPGRDHPGPVQSYGEEHDARASLGSCMPLRNSRLPGWRSALQVRRPFYQMDCLQRQTLWRWWREAVFHRKCDHGPDGSTGRDFQPKHGWCARATRARS